MISDLFKSICHDQSKRVIKRHDEHEREQFEHEREHEREQFEHEREHERERFEREHDELMLFVRLVQHSVR